MSFAYKGTFVVDHTKVPSTQTNFPVLISVTDNSLKTVGNGGQMQSSSGFDFRPYSDTGLTSALTYQLHFYNGTAGTIVLRVLIASLSASADTTIYCGFGDASLTTDGSSRAVWDSSFKGVFLLGDGTTLSVADSSNGGPNNGTNHGVTATSGKVDGAGAFVAASTQYIDVANESTFDIDSTTAFSISLWLQHTAGASGSQAIISKIDPTGNNPGMLILLDCDNNRIRQYLLGSAGDGFTISGDISSFSDGVMHHLAVTYSGSGLNTGYHFILDGVDSTITPGGTIASSPLNNIDVFIGHDGETGSYFDGKMDEVRISIGTARSVNWHITEYNNENNPASGGFYSSITFGVANIPRFILGTH